MPLCVLALDASVGRTAACLICGEQAWYAGLEDARPRSADIASRLAELLADAGLAWRDVDAFALGAGPGSFTGLRIAAATLAGFNAGVKRPILHLSSLAITAIQAQADAAITVLEDARAGEAFVGRYRGLAPLARDACMHWHEVARLQPGLWTGHSQPAIELPGWQFLAPVKDRDHALEACLRAALQQETDAAWPMYPQPVYLQASQAERNAHA